MADIAIFLIEGPGKAMDLVKRHIADVLRVKEWNREVANELGITEAVTSRIDGKVTGVVFPKGASHPDFGKPKKGVSYPKKKTEWWKKLTLANGWEPPSDRICRELGIPTVLSYSDGHGSGWRRLGLMFEEAGFLYLSKDGPYALWTADVPAEVAEHEARGCAVEEPAKSFKLEFEGCRRIHKEEWDLLVAQVKLKEKLEGAKP